MPKKTCAIGYWRRCWSQLSFLIVLILVVPTTLGCNSKSSKQVYKYPDYGVSLERSGNWDSKTIKRGGQIILTAKNGTKDKNAIRIEILGASCAPSQNIDPVRSVALDIERIRGLYNLISVTVVEAPSMTESRGYTIAKAKIAIPTMSIPEESPRNTMGTRAANVFQVIEIIEIRDTDNRTRSINIYKGTNVVLNAEADAIVDSIQIICPRPTATPG
jgi:hypothetical protein